MFCCFARSGLGKIAGFGLLFYPKQQNASEGAGRRPHVRSPKQTTGEATKRDQNPRKMQKKGRKKLTNAENKAAGRAFACPLAPAPGKATDSVFPHAPQARSHSGGFRLGAKMAAERHVHQAGSRCNLLSFLPFPWPIRALHTGSEGKVGDASSFLTVFVFYPCDISRFPAKVFVVSSRNPINSSRLKQAQ